jgi:hypothetical protein
MMSDRDADPHNHLRAAARARAERTVTRLQTGVLALQGRHELVTARTIERETGLTFKTIQRNAAAYDLNTGAADVFRYRSKRQPTRRGRARSPKQPVRDALLAYKKPHLVERLRQALQRIEALETALAVQAATCQEQHLRTMLSLRVENHRLQSQRLLWPTQ